MTNFDPNDGSREHDDSDSNRTYHALDTQTRTDYPRMAHEEEHNEEYAAEFAPTRADYQENERGDFDSETPVQAEGAGKTVGYIGVGLGIVSLFMWSIILGPIAAVMGFYAYSQDRKTSGAWAIGLGVLATLSYFVLIPFTR